MTASVLKLSRRYSDEDCERAMARSIEWSERNQALQDANEHLQSQLVDAQNELRELRAQAKKDSKQLSSDHLKISKLTNACKRHEESMRDYRSRWHKEQKHTTRLQKDMQKDRQRLAKALNLMVIDEAGTAQECYSRIDQGMKVTGYVLTDKASNKHSLVLNGKASEFSC